MNNHLKFIFKLCNIHLYKFDSLVLIIAISRKYASYWAIIKINTSNTIKISLSNKPIEMDFI